VALLTPSPSIPSGSECVRRLHTNFLRLESMRVWYDAVGSPQIGRPPDPDKPAALRTCSVSGKEFGCMTARPSPQ
jgi:hypothetical protein